LGLLAASERPVSARIGDLQGFFLRSLYFFSHRVMLWAVECCSWWACSDRLRWPHGANQRAGGVFLCATLSEQALPTGHSGDKFPPRSFERHDNAVRSQPGCPISVARVTIMIVDQAESDISLREIHTARSLSRSPIDSLGNAWRCPSHREDAVRRPFRGHRDRWINPRE
jgi:hypothetical protein